MFPKGQATPFFIHAYRLLYAPIDILKEINENANNTRKTLIFLVKSLFVQILLYSSYSLFLFFFLELFSYILDTEPMYNIKYSYINGSVFVTLFFIGAAIIFFANSVKEKGRESLWISFSRATTRLWLFGIIGGLFNILNSSKNIFSTDLINIYFFISLTFFIGYFLRRTVQLMLIAQDVDQLGVENRQEILIQKETKNIEKKFLGSIVVLLILTFLLDSSLNLGIFNTQNNLFVSLRITFYILPIGLGYILALYLRLEYIFFWLTFKCFSNPNRRLQFIQYDEILNKFSPHENNLINLKRVTPSSFFQYTDFYFSYSKYKEEIVTLFYQQIFSTKKYNALNTYLNSSKLAKLIFNLEDNTKLNRLGQKNEHTKLALKQIHELKDFQKFYSQNTSPIFFINRKGTLIFPVFKTIQKGIKKITIFNYDKELSILKKNLINTYHLNPENYLYQTTSTIIDQLYQYYIQEKKDYENNDLAISLVETSLGLNEEKIGYVHLQLENRMRISIEILNIIPKIIGRNKLMWETFDFEKIITREGTNQLFIPIKLIDNSKKLEIEIKIKYQIEGVNKNKEYPFTLDIIPHQPFKAFKNPYSLKKVKGDKMFFGRKSELETLRRIIDNIPTTNIITLSAQRRIGKTALLEKLERDYLNDTAIDYTYIDGQNIQFFEGDSDYNQQKLLAKIGQQCLKISNISSWEILLDKLSRQNKQKVIALDEFDVILQSLQEHQIQRFISQIRNSKSVNSPLFIFSLPNAAIQQSPDNIKNILWTNYPLDLVPLNEKDTIQLISKPIRKVCRFSPEAINFIFKKCGGFPHLVQAYMSDLVAFINLNLKKTWIDIEDIYQYEKNSRINYKKTLKLFAENLPTEKRQVLKLFKLNNNEYLQKDFDRLIKLSEIKQETVEKLLENNILALRGQKLSVASSLLLEHIN